jgi:hypothetical protein
MMLREQNKDLDFTVRKALEHIEIIGAPEIDYFIYWRKDEKLCIIERFKIAVMRKILLTRMKNKKEFQMKELIA